MKWDAKNCLLALFLCMVFVLVVGYGAFSFGGDDMGNCSSSATFTLQIRDACGCCRCVRFKESEIYPNEGFENAKKILVV